MKEVVSKLKQMQIWLATVYIFYNIYLCEKRYILDAELYQLQNPRNRR